MLPRLRIGLTGGIASGKSTVAARFGELGVPVIDADEVAREEVAPGSVGLGRVVARFGPGVLSADGHLDRRILRGMIFSDASLRQDLEAILHPLIRATMDGRTTIVAGPYVVMAIPLLLERGTSAGRVDRILVVDVDEEVQLTRVMARDACPVEQARAIIAAQASRSMRLQAADDVLVNDGSIAELRASVDVLHARYLDLALMKSP
jgi:dephospho-CoA kinase